jgi:23S rRNA (uracil1939-C5)-methyltransferase
VIDCVHAKACGGCALIELPYDKQLAKKHDRVTDALSGYPALAGVGVREVVGTAERDSYRTRAKMMVGKGARVGLFGAGGHEVVDIPGCRVAAPVIAAVLEALRTMLRRAEADGGAMAAVEGGGCLSAIDVREVRPPQEPAPRVLVTFVVERTPSFRLEAMREAASTLMDLVPSVLGVALNFHEVGAPQVLGAETMLLVGKGSSEDVLGGSTHKATFGSFVQAHRGQTARVHDLVAGAVLGGNIPGKPVKVLDLYGGSGSIALALAAKGADVLMVESFLPATRQALEVAQAFKLRLRVERTDVVDALGRLVDRRTHDFDAAVVNPPRRGLDPKVRERLARLGLSTLVYVSCQPETLARDLAHLGRLGLGVTELVPVDMIPLTAEVETIAVLHAAPSPAPRVLYEDAQVVIVDKDPHEPTTPQGEHDRSLLARVQALPGANEAVPVHRLDVGTSGVVMFAKNARFVAGWASALGADACEKVYTAAVRGVLEGDGVVDVPLREGPKSHPARTRYEVTRVVGLHTLLRLFPEQGRTHQIRKHLAAIDHPVLGDARYGHVATNRFFFEKHGLDRPFLHAARLDIVHPVTHKRLVVEAELPGDLVVVSDLEA